MPFPREETTPPVTKMYLVAFGPEVIGLPLKCMPMGFRPSKVVRSVDARQRGLVEPRDADGEAAVQRPKLLQPLGQLSRAGFGRDPPRQCRAGAGVNAQMLPVEVGAVVRGLTAVWN